MTVTIQPFRIKRPNYDTSLLVRSLDNWGRTSREDEALARQQATARAVGERLTGGDLRGAQAAAFEGGDMRTGLSLRTMEQQDDDRAFNRGRLQQQDARLAASDARARANEEEARTEKARQYVGNMMTTLNPNDPNFASDWAGHISRLRAAGHKIGPEYDDPRTGYQMALAETTDFRTRADIKARGQDQRLRERDQDIRAQGSPADREMDDYFVDDGGVLQRRPSFQQASFPGGMAPGQSTGVPGTLIEQAQARQGRPTADERRAATVADIERQHDVKGDQTVPEHVVQRYWTGVYGQKPPSGMRYGRDGGLINMKGAAGDNTRAATKGALDASVTAIADVREALASTSMVGRGFEAATGYSGTFNRSMAPLRMAIRGVLHGISGAQVNIPEQQEYFNSFLPTWNDRADTINMKLNHLEFMLGSIQKASGGGYQEADVQRLRNEMRKGLGLLAKESAAPDQRPTQQQRDRDRRRDLRSMSDEDLLKALRQ